MVIPEQYVCFVRDAFIAARCLRAWGGLEFQQAIREIARINKGLVVQGPGQTGFFGRQGASRLRHEIDTGLQGRAWVGFVEVKAVAGGPGKNDIMIFDGKTFDLYVNRLLGRRAGPHLRTLISSEPIALTVESLCYQRGIVCVEPHLLPLPLLLRLLETPACDLLFDDVEMEEADRLFTAASAPMERVWTPQGGILTIQLKRFAAPDLDDLRYLHERMSKLIVEHLDQSDPGWEWRHTTRLISRSATLSAALRAA